MASSSSSSSPSTIQQRGSLYDVFLSFSGTDTRNTFISHLLAALNRQGFSTFHDETELQRGEDIRSQLPTAISESRVSIVVFSKNYPSSGWCLDELVKIMDCKRDFNQIVLPIFYHVDPSDVRYQKGCYAEAFKKHEDRYKGASSMERVGRWRKALTQAANLSGWHLVDRDEAKLIKEVVNDVLNRLDQLYCHVADRPVGMESRLQELKKMLKLESDDVTIVSVWGVGGIGKTTIAKAVFNSIRNKFEGCSFLADVSETAKTPSGMVALQKQLLSNILSSNAPNLDNRHQGIDLIKQKLRHRRVLLVLDDVDDVEQLKKLAINRDLFCAGSKIIITTRNKSSLASIQVDSLYSPLELNDDESLKLFSLNAFKTDHPEEEYSELSHEVVAYAEGLPLALEVLGSSFASIRNKVEWECSLKKLRKHLPKDILGKLRISFDSLHKHDRDLFLDIAFFFTGRDKDFTVKVLEDPKCFPESGIGELGRRCLIRVDKYNKLRMHNLLREMAREIVYQESSEGPRKCSRYLRGHEEVLEVLRDSIGREAIEGLYLELPESNKEDINVAAFADMRELRLLHFNYLCHLTGTDLTVSRKLKWLCWHQFPLACIPDDVYMGNLVAIDLKYSRLKQIWKGTKILDKLRFLNLSHSCYLTKTPDFSGLINLEELLLNGCTNLVEVDYSIGCLDKLVTLNMANCRSIRKVPSNIFMLTSLQHLDLSGCSLLELGESGGLFSMFWRRLLPLYKSVPISAVSSQGSSRLKYLNLSWCNLLHVPSEIGDLTSLQKLYLRGNKFSSIPSLRKLLNLICIYLDSCDKLKHLPLLPNDVQFLFADCCLSLEAGPDGTQWVGADMNFLLNCPKLDVNKIGQDPSRFFRDNCRGNCSETLVLHCGELPLDLDFYGNESRLSFVVPLVMGRKIRGWILRAVFNLAGYEDDMVIYTCTCSDVRRNKEVGEHISHLWILEEDEYMQCTDDVMWVDHVGPAMLYFKIKGGDELEFDFDLAPKKWGIRLIYEDDEYDDDEYEDDEYEYEDDEYDDDEYEDDENPVVLND